MNLDILFFLVTIYGYSFLTTIAQHKYLKQICKKICHEHERLHGMGVRGSCCLLNCNRRVSLESGLGERSEEEGVWMQCISSW